MKSRKSSKQQRDPFDGAQGSLRAGSGAPKFLGRGKGGRLSQTSTRPPPRREHKNKYRPKG